MMTALSAIIGESAGGVAVPGERSRDSRTCALSSQPRPGPDHG